jgi:hypothetical protein
LALLKLTVTNERYRAGLGIQAGTYANDNYVLEPGVLKNVYEASAGVALTSKGNLWLDAGVFSSNLGFESAVSTENFTLTRSLVAESSPYFLSGAKITYSPSEKWELVVLASNGWQHIKRVEGNSLMSWGTQVQFKPDASTTFNWSTFIGTDDPDVSRRMRYFNNIYGLFEFSNSWSLIAGFDFGLQQNAKGSSTYSSWIAPVGIIQYKMSKDWSTAARVEYYQDEMGVIIPTGTPNGFKTTGYSLNLDYQPNPVTLCRIEGRLFNSVDDVFEKGVGFTDNNFVIMASLAIGFGKVL